MNQPQGRKQIAIWVLSIGILGGVLFIGCCRTRWIWRLTPAEVRINGNSTSEWAVYQNFGGDVLMTSEESFYLISPEKSHIVLMNRAHLRVCWIWAFYIPDGGVPLDGSSAKVDFFSANLETSSNQIKFNTINGKSIYVRLRN